MSSGKIKGRVFKNMVNLYLILRCHYLKFYTASIACYFWFSSNNTLRIKTSPISINLLSEASVALTLISRSCSLYNVALLKIIIMLYIYNDFNNKPQQSIDLVAR